MAWLIFAAAAGIVITLCAVGLFWQSWRGRDVFIAMLYTMAVLLSIMSVLNSAADISDTGRIRRTSKRCEYAHPPIADAHRIGYVTPDQVRRAAAGGGKK